MIAVAAFLASIYDQLERVLRICSKRLGLRRGSAESRMAATLVVAGQRHNEQIQMEADLAFKREPPPVYEHPPSYDSVASSVPVSSRPAQAQFPFTQASTTCSPVHAAVVPQRPFAGSTVGLTGAEDIALAEMSARYTRSLGFTVW